MNREKILLFHIIKHCIRIETLLHEKVFEDFNGNDDLRELVCFNELQIGELVKKLNSDFRSRYPDVPWKQIAGMRDNIVHGYGNIDYNLIYNSALTGVPELKKYCKSIIEKIE